MYSEKSNKILSLLLTKGNKKCWSIWLLESILQVYNGSKTESTFISKTVVSLEIKVHEVYIKPRKPRGAVLSIKESDDEESDNKEIQDLENVMKNISDTEEDN